MLMHVCPHQGCTEVIPIDQPYCDKHVSRHKQYDESIRLVTDSKLHSFYVSKEWEAVKQIVNQKYFGLCVWSYYHNSIQPYQEIHHIEPIRTNWESRLDINNLIPLSHNVHMMIEKEYRIGNRNSMQKELFNLINRWEKEFSKG